MLLGFLQLLLLIVIATILVLLSLGSLSKDFRDFDNTQHDTLAIMSIDNVTTELQQSVERFTETGSLLYADKVHKLKERLVRRLSTLSSSESSSNLTGPLQRMREHLESYVSYFETVVNERNIRSEAVDGQLFVEADFVRQNTHELMSIHTKDDKRLNTLSLALNEFLMGERSALIFLERPNSSLVRQAKFHLRRAEEHLHTISEQDGVEKTIQGISEFERTFLRVVQATRGYLYLVNVLMPAEAFELLFNLDALQERSMSNLERITHDFELKARQIAVVALAISAFALLLGIFRAFSILRILDVAGLTGDLRPFL